MAGSGPDDGMVTVLDPDRPSVHLATLRRGRPGPRLRHEAGAPEPAEGLRPDGRRRRPGRDLADRHGPRLDRDPGQDRSRRGRHHDATRSPPAASTTSRSATGTRRRSAAAGPVTYAYSGAPEAVALDQDRAGKVLLVELDERAGGRQVTVQEHQVGRTQLRQDRGRRRHASRASRPWSRCSRRGRTRTSSSMRASSASVPTSSTCTSTRSRPRSRRPSSRSASATRRIPALTQGPLPSPDTIAGAFIRDLEARIAELEADGLDGRGRRAPRRAPPRAACCSPATRCRCEGAPDQRPRLPALSRPSTSSWHPA